MKTLYYVSKQNKLQKGLEKYLKSKQEALEKRYGQEKSEKISQIAREEYPAIIEKMPYYNTPMYDMLIVVNSKMMALKKGMKACNIGVEEFVKFNIDEARAGARKIPSFMRKLGGKIYLSKLMQKYLRKVAISATENGWPTKLITGKKPDDYEISIETRNCQMVNFDESVGEGDIKPYCSFFDFTSAEILGLGLKQISTIDSGVCKYCFYKRGEVQWPHAIKNVLNN